VTIDVEAPSAPSASRLSARSAVAVADVELARNTLSNLLERPPIEVAGERVIARLRRIVVRDSDGLHSRS
jgi:hypothetical protein